MAAAGGGGDGNGARDIGKLKRQVEEKLAIDTARHSSIKDSLQKSQDMTKKMVSLLGAFGDRLSTLEGVIRPVHLETLTLTRARDNIRQTMTLLGELESFHEVAARTDSIIQQSPAHQLDAYLGAMDTVRKALTYFEESNPGHPEKAKLTRLQNTGFRFLEHEFHQVLERHSFAVDVEELLAMTNEAVAATPLLSQDVIATLRRIASWLTEADCTTELVRSFAKVRSHIVTFTLSSLVEQQAGTKDGPRQQRQSVMFTPKGTGMKRQTSTHKVLQRGAASSSSTDGKKQEGRSALDVETENRPGAYTKNSHPFISFTRVLLRLLRREALLAANVMQEKLVAPLLHNVLGSVMDSYISQGELLVAALNKRIAQQHYFSCLCVFDIIAYMSTKQAEFERIVKYLDRNECATRFTALLHNFIDQAKRILDDFVREVSSDAGRKLPADGTVHETTSNVLSFMVHTFEYCEVVGNVLVPRRVDSLSFAVTAESSRALGKWLNQVLDALDRHLGRNAKLYESAALRCVFLINNYDYILRFLATAPFRDALLAFDPKVEAHFKDVIQSQRDEYRHATWSHLQEVLVIEDYHEGNITKKEKDAIKDKYSTFNDEFDRIVAEQQAFSMPNEQLRTSLRQDNEHLLLPLFKRFDMHYRHSGFTTKNPQKYLRFTPDEVVERLSLMFEALV